MPGYLADQSGLVGAKVINSNPSNVNRNEARASGLTLLFDAESGQVVSILEGAHLSALRTAAVSALAVELLAPHPLRSIAILGAGEQARAHLALLVPRWPTLQQINLFDLKTERVARLADDLVAHLGIRRDSIRPAASAQAAIAGANLIVTVTTTTEPYIELGWLEPGCLVVNVSLDDLKPEVLLKADRLYVDDWNLIKEDQHRLLGRLYRAGLVADGAPVSRNVQPIRRIDGQLGDLVLRRIPGRQSAEERIVVNPFGLSLEDVALAQHIQEAARKTGRGQWLPR
jgi:ornithine cyclodeaminase